MPHFMIVLIPYINLSNLSRIIKCLFFKEYGAFNKSNKNLREVSTESFGITQQEIID